MNFKVYEGCTIYYDFISLLSEIELMEEIDSKDWTNINDREYRSQQYGPEELRFSQFHITEALPSLIDQLLRQLPDQQSSSINLCEVSEFMIENQFRRRIENAVLAGSVSIMFLNEDANIYFKRTKGKIRGTDSYDISIKAFLPRRSLLVMTEDFRTDWSYEIPKCASINVSEDVIGYIGILGHPEDTVVGINRRKVMKDPKYRLLTLTYRYIKEIPDEYYMKVLKTLLKESRSLVEGKIISLDKPFLAIPSDKIVPYVSSMPKLDLETRRDRKRRKLDL